MSLVKLANKLTKMYNTLSEAAQQKAAPLLRSEGRFVKGIEKGNRRLLSELQKRERKSFVFNNIKNSLSSNVFRVRDDGIFQISKFKNNDIVANIPKNPKTLDEAIVKRHEIWELQHMLKHKNVNKSLSAKYRQNAAKNNQITDFNTKLDKQLSIINKRRNVTSANMLMMDDKESPVYLKNKKVFDYASDRYKKSMMQYKDYVHVADPLSKFHSHLTPQILVNESKMMQTTPNATKTSLYKYRLNSGEIPDLKHGFNFDYFQKK
jgi:hypothetical protein